MDQVVKTQVKRLVHIWNYILCLAQYQTQIWHKYPSLCSFVTFYYFFWRDVLKSQALEKVQASVMWAYFIWVFLWFYIIIMWAFACWKLHFHIAENLMIACPWAWNFRRSLIIPSQHLEYYGCICKQLIVHTVADICVYYCLEITYYSAQKLLCSPVTVSDYRHNWYVIQQRPEIPLSLFVLVTVIIFALLLYAFCCCWEVFFCCCYCLFGLFHCSKRCLTKRINLSHKYKIMQVISHNKVVELAPFPHHSMFRTENITQMEACLIQLFWTDLATVINLKIIKIQWLSHQMWSSAHRQIGPDTKISIKR